LVNEVSQAEIGDAIDAGDDVTAVADDLVEMSITRGGHDNVSVVVAEVAW
jgi:serine/threonine protein phosphatase PrpC